MRAFVLRSSLLVLAAALVSSCQCGVAPLVDAGVDSGARPDAGPLARCPPRFAGSGDPDGLGIERGPYGCYGACGPSCKAECLSDTVTVHQPATTASGQPGCLACTYRVQTCKSHEFCRWHDDCYRQCDLRWEALHAEPEATPPSNPCYRNCDNPVVQASALCGEDWSQVTVSTASVRDACWDGSLVLFSSLDAEVLAAVECPTTTDHRARPWAPNAGAWGDFAAAPATLPRGYSCTNDTDCPDRNQGCDPHAGDYPGVNGWGRCVDLVPSPGVDVRPLAPTSLWVVDAGRPGGSACVLAWECTSGVCRAGVCDPTP